jgi:hypothetical protein
MKSSVSAVVAFQLFLACANSAVGLAQGEIETFFGDKTVIGNGSQAGRVKVDFPPLPAGAVDPYSYSYGHACLSDGVGFGDSPSCGAARAACRERPEGMLVSWYRQLGGSEPERLESGCLYPGAAPERPGGGSVVAVTEAQLRQLPIAPAALGLQPGRHTLKGAETNVYADSAPQSFRTTVLGRAVEVRVAPVEHRFDYGDGTSLVSAAPGGPLPQQRWGEKTATSHRYTATGDYTLALTTVYAGEFSVEGGPFQPIPGTATVPSPTREVSVWRSQVRLYAQTCTTNPHAEAC